MKTKPTYWPTPEQSSRLVVSESFKAFLERNYQDSRVARLLYTAATSPLPVASRITSDALNYLTNRSDGMISYLPKGKECQYTQDGLWARSNRQEGKPARVINRVLSPHLLRILKQSEVEFFANLYNAFTVLNTYARIEHVTGSAIEEVYTFKPCGFSSCMQNHNQEGMFDLYTENPDVIGCLAMYDDRGEDTDGCTALIGRALTWKIDGQTYVDRIYGRNTDCIEFLKAKAQERGWIVKARQTYDDKDTWLKPSGELFRAQLRVKLQTSWDYYPYLDTFTYGGDGWLCNDGSCNYLYIYTCTDGQRYEYVTCTDGERRDQDSCRYSNHCGGWIPYSQGVELNGEWYHTDDVSEVRLIRDEAGRVFPVSDFFTATGYRLPDGSLVADGSWRCLNRVI